MDREALSEYLKEIGYTESADRLAGYIDGMALLYRKTALEEPLSWDIMGMLSRTEKGWEVTGLKNPSDGTPYDYDTDTTLSEWVQEWLEKDYEEGQERFREFFPDLRKDNMSLTEEKPQTQTVITSSSEIVPKIIIGSIIAIVIIIILLLLCIQIKRKH